MNPLKKLEQHPKLQNAFRQLGADWLVTDELQREMESFTCIMYGQARMTSVDAVQAKMLRKMVSADKVHPSINLLCRLSGVGSWGQQPKQGSPDFPLPSHFV